MNCDQIRPWLADFRSGSIPAYRSAWVAQHLASCEACRTLAAELALAPAATAAEPVPHQESTSVALNRRVPRWRRNLAVVLASGFVASLPWAFMLATETRSGAPGALPTTGGPDSSRITPLGFQATMQRQEGATLYVESAVLVGNELRVRLRFEGDSLAAPPAAEGWVVAFDRSRAPIPARMGRIQSEMTGISAEVLLPAGMASDAFALRFTGINRTWSRRWVLPLPFIDGDLATRQQNLEGSPAGVRLERYGAVHGKLRIELRTPPSVGAESLPRLHLKDAAGTVLAPTLQSQSAGWGSGQLVLEFPLVQSMQEPMALVGDAFGRKHLGPWLIEVNVVR